MREAAATVARLAAAFEEIGVDEGARIAVIGANSPWHYIVHVAASWLRAVTAVAPDAIAGAHPNVRTGWRLVGVP